MTVQILACLLVVTILSTSAHGAKLETRHRRAADGSSMVVCYYPNWSQYRQGPAKFVVSDIDPFLCTHLLYAFAKIEGNDLAPYEWNDEDMYRQFNNLKLINPGLKTLLSVGGYTLGTQPFIDVSSTPANRAEFSANVLSYIRRFRFDGVDMDWEFPRDVDKHNHRELMADLKGAFELEAALTGRPVLLLSCAMGANRNHIENSYDLIGLAEHLDFGNVMAYDLHGSWDGITGFHSALHGYHPEDPFAQKWVVEHYLAHGFPPEKTVLGIPTYGRSFTLCSPWNHDVRDCSRAAGNPGPWTLSAGTLAYYEICTQLDDDLTREYDLVQKVPYAYGGDQWVGYDDPLSITSKARFIEDKSLAGVMFWDISMDDFGDMCGGGEFPLINAAKQSGEVPTAPVETTDEPDLEPTTTMPFPEVETTTAALLPTTGELEGISCDETDDLEFIRDPYDCSVYYQCVAGTAYMFECPSGLYFDLDAQVCNWDYMVDC